MGRPKKDRQGVALSLYLSPERLDMLGIQDSEHPGPAARKALLLSVDTVLTPHDRLVIASAAAVYGLPAGVWSRQTVVLAARDVLRKAGKPLPPEPTPAVSKPAVASRPPAVVMPPPPVEEDVLFT